MTREEYDARCRSEESKTCTKCGKTKTLSGFPFQKKKDSGWVSSWCRTCHSNSVDRWESKNAEKVKEYRRAHYKSNSDKYKSRARENRIRRVYGISSVDYASMIAAHGGVCAICLMAPEQFCIDHDHASGKVRGLLCSKCNSAIGLLKESKENLERANKYLSSRADD